MKMHTNSNPIPTSWMLIESDRTNPNSTESGERSNKRSKRSTRSNRRNRNTGEPRYTMSKKLKIGGIVARKSTAVTGLVQKSFLNSNAQARKQNSKKNSKLYASSISSSAFIEISPVYHEMSSR